MSDRPLQGTIAVVAGASRGAGRGIAIELGAAGATVYVTGRTTREHQPDTYESIKQVMGRSSMPGTIEDTADEVTRAGGVGIPVRCDHTREDEIAALFARVERDHGRLDVLVNNAWGGHEAFAMENFSAPFWLQPLEQWDAMIDRGARSHLLTARCAAPLFVRRRAGLIVGVSFYDRGMYLKGNVFYDLAKALMNRIALAVAEELRPYGVASVAVSPGFMRTELVLGTMHTDEASYREVPALARSESPRRGRARHRSRRARQER
jgi:NAD(P)-dependent dehydrogenase (short-subunit alcohol dehydrogenase family)